MIFLDRRESRVGFYRFALHINYDLDAKSRRLPSYVRRVMLWGSLRAVVTFQRNGSDTIYRRNRINEMLRLISAWYYRRWDMISAEDFLISRLSYRITRCVFSKAARQCRKTDSLHSYAMIVLVIAINFTSLRKCLFAFPALVLWCLWISNL